MIVLSKQLRVPYDLISFGKDEVEAVLSGGEGIDWNVGKQPWEASPKKMSSMAEYTKKLIVSLCCHLAYGNTCQTTTLNPRQTNGPQISQLEATRKHTFAR